MKFQIERILLFSDAVFAIAITMMIIEIKPPHLGEEISFSKALMALLSKMNIFIGNIISFYMIALYWHRHHHMMQYVHSYDNKFIVINFVLLLSVSFIPFSTTFVFENVSALTSLTYIVYNLNHLFTSVCNYRLAAYALNPKHGLCHEAHEKELHDFKLYTVFAVIVFVIVMLVSCWNTLVAPLLYRLFGLQDLVLKRWRKK